MKTVKRRLCVILAVVMLLGLLPGRAAAAEIIESGVCGESITWQLQRDGTLALSGSGATWDFTKDNAPFRGMRYSSSAPKALKLVIPEGITRLGNYLFFEADLGQVSFPSSLEEIGEYTFYSACMGQKLVIPGNVKTVNRGAFQETSGLEQVTIGNGVETIGVMAFSGMDGLSFVKLPESVSKIEGGAFLFNSGAALILSGDNPHYTQKNNCLFSKDMTQLVHEKDITKAADLSVYPDKAKISSWAKTALAWAVAEGFISGSATGGKTYADPKGYATRAQVATILMRYVRSIEG